MNLRRNPREGFNPFTYVGVFLKRAKAGLSAEPKMQPKREFQPLQKYGGFFFSLDGVVGEDVVSAQQIAVLRSSVHIPA